LSPTPAPPLTAWRLVLLLTQGLWVARTATRLPPAGGPLGGEAGEGRPLHLLAIGDSIVAGVGVDRTDEALPARLAVALAAEGDFRVSWRAEGRSGARSARVLSLLADLPPTLPDPDLVVVSNGINDATAPPAESRVLEGLCAVVEALERRFPRAAVFQLGLPPLGAFPALPQPLRAVLGRRARALDARLGDWLSTRPRSWHLPFRETPEPAQFAPDGYHPGPAAVAAWAEDLAPRMIERLAAAEAPVPTRP